MQGVLEMYETVRGVFRPTGLWTQYLATLKDDVLTLSDLKDMSVVHGKIHMKVSKLLPD